MTHTLARRVTAEFLGTALLVAAVIGSGIMAQRLAPPGNVALALLANTIATAAALIALILTFGPISGAHFNPAVTLAVATLPHTERDFPRRELPAYLAAQLTGAFAGAALANIMFGLPLFSASTHIRSGPAQWLSEFVATFGLLAVIWGVTRPRLNPSPFLAPLAVACWITAAYWFTASTSFANPAVTLARAASNSFAGIRPADTPAFLIAQFAGALAATSLFRWLYPRPPHAAEILLHHPES